jgi:thiol peroxidase
MSTITIKGQAVKTVGELPKPGSKAPDFTLTKTDLSDTTLKNYTGKIVVLNIFPSVDTPVCSASVRRFNQEISTYPNAVVICASLDLPFAHARFCEAEGLKDVIPVSEFRNRDFGDTYGVRIIEGPLTGLLARSVVVIDEKGEVIYSKLVEELTTEPDYEDVLAVLKKQALDVCTSSDTAEQSRFADNDEPCDDGRDG